MVLDFKHSKGGGSADRVAKERSLLRRLHTFATDLQTLGYAYTYATMAALRELLVIMKHLLEDLQQDLSAAIEDTTERELLAKLVEHFGDAHRLPPKAKVFFFALESVE